MVSNNFALEELKRVNWDAYIIAKNATYGGFDGYPDHIKQQYINAIYGNDPLLRAIAEFLHFIPKS